MSVVFCEEWWVGFWLFWFEYDLFNLIYVFLNIFEQIKVVWNLSLSLSIYLDLDRDRDRQIIYIYIDR